MQPAHLRCSAHSIAHLCCLPVRVANDSSGNSGSGNGTGNDSSGTSNAHQGVLFLPTDCQACRLDPNGREVPYVRFQLTALSGRCK